MAREARATFGRRWRARRGVAAVEFAIALPIVLQLLGIIDFASAAWTKAVLAESVAEGAEFAILKGPTVASSDIKSVVGQRLSIPSSKITVTGPACYCLSGTPATSASATCGSTCSDGTSPGTYVTISASYTYAPVISMWNYVGTPVLTESVTSRVQ